MKKKVLSLLVLSSLIVSMFAIPVAAQEVTDPTKVIKEETFDANEDLLIKDFKNAETWRCNNYVEYLDGVIYNLNETARIKKEIVTNYTNLAKVNPYFQTLLPNAIKDYEQAVAWVEYYKAYKAAVKANFAVKYK